MSRAAIVGLVLLLALALGGGYLAGSRLLGGPSRSAGSAVDGACREGGNLMAMVGDMPISTADIDAELAVQKALQGLQGLVMPNDPETLQSFRRELLDQVVDQYVLLSAARAAGYAATPEQVQAELPALLTRYGASPDALRQAAALDGIDSATFDRWTERQVVNGRYLTQVAPYSSPEDQAARLQDQIALSFCVAGQAVAPASVGQPAPDFELATPEGGTIRLSELRGKAVMVNFWATWCGPCKIEMPLYVSAYEAHKDELVVLAVDVEEPAATVQSYVANNGLTFPVALDARGEVSLLYRVRGLPTTYFVDAAGIIVDKHRGAILSQPELQPYLDRILPSALQGWLRLPGQGSELGAGAAARGGGRIRVVDPGSAAG